MFSEASPFYRKPRSQNIPMLSSLIALSVLLRSEAVDMKQFLVTGPFESGGRTPCPVDPIQYLITTDSFKEPSEKDSLQAGDFKKPIKWRNVQVGEDGWLSGNEMNGGYAYFRYQSPKDQILILNAQGHSMVYVNGEPRAGDPYGFGIVQLPVFLKKGPNQFLFAVGRGRLKARLEALDSDQSILAGDSTLPDLIQGEERELLGSVVIRNATVHDFQGELKAKIGDFQSQSVEVDLTPLTIKKVAFKLPKSNAGNQKQETLSLELIQNNKVISRRDFVLDVKSPNQMHKRTFESSVDGSIQYYAVQPASNRNAKALVMSLHGAGVEATGQASSYGQKPWCHIVCPTNGRPFGFDWEDWGRINALDALADAKKIYEPDSDRIYLTGHSMGGHGTWQIGLTNPQLFAALAPCAGWISFWSYAGAADWKNPDEIETMLRRAANPSDTLKLIENSKDLGIFIQHGDADDNVPVEQARRMRTILSEFHHDFDWHEEPGQSHWFDTDPEDGANVQDYAPLFDFLSKHRIPGESEKRFSQLTTCNLKASAKVANVTILDQQKISEPSQVRFRTYANGSVQEITTKNVATLRVESLSWGQTQTLIIDGQKMSQTSGDFEFEKSQWSPTSSSYEIRSVGIKQCINKQFVFQDSGSKDIQAWAYNKARYDAETWWYRGNGTMLLVPLSKYRSGPAVFYGQYGIGPTSDQVKIRNKTTLQIGDMNLSGDLGLLLVLGASKQPNGFIGGLTLKGCRAIERAPIFLSGVHYADIFVCDPSMAIHGSKGVFATGFMNQKGLFDDLAIRH